MDLKTGRPDHIKDYLVRVRRGQWYGWSDSKNQVYANLIVHDGGSKPTEQECIDGFKKLQDDFDAQEYARKRLAEYPNLKDFAEAYTEKEIGGDSTKWDVYVINYNKVRTENPK